MFRSARLHALDKVDPRGVAQRRTVWAVCSTLLDYPTPELVEGLDELSGVVAGLPPTYAVPLGRLIARRNKRQK